MKKEPEIFEESGEDFFDLMDEVEELLESLPETKLKKQLLDSFDEAIDKDDVVLLKQIKQKAQTIIDKRSELMHIQKIPGPSVRITKLEIFFNDPNFEEQSRLKLEQYHDLILNQAGVLLGTGNTAKVFFHPRWEGFCTKILTDTSSSNFSLSLPDEAKIMSDLDFLQVSGARIPKTYSYYQNGNIQFYVMERIVGITIEDLIREHKRPGANFNVEKFFNAVDDFVSAMHEQKIYHRDLHKGNIMIDTKTGEPRIIDFGAAKKVIFGLEDPYIDTSATDSIHWTKDEDNVNRAKAQLLKYLNNLDN